jgi:upstream activation factor subunit UAF30
MAAKGKTGTKKPVKKAATAKKATKGKAPAKKTAAKKAAAKKPAKKAVKKRTPNPAFMKAMQPSDALAKVVGSKPLPRTEITKKLWDYIKKNKLQDTKNKRNINADANLTAVFGGKKQVSMFEMTKLVSKHLS